MLRIGDLTKAIISGNGCIVNKKGLPPKERPGK